MSIVKPSSMLSPLSVSLGPTCHAEHYLDRTHGHVDGTQEEAKAVGAAVLDERCERGQLQEEKTGSFFPVRQSALIGMNFERL